MGIDPGAPPEELVRLLDHAEEAGGCVQLSELEHLTRTLHLDEADAELVYDAIEARGLSVSDDCGRQAVPPTSYLNGDLAHATTDALGLFLNEIRRHKLLTVADEVALAKRIEQGDAEEMTLRDHAVRSAVQALPERERAVVELRYGVDGEGPLGLREVGRRLGVTTTEVKRLEEGALARLSTVRELEALRSAA